MYIVYFCHGASFIYLTLFMVKSIILNPLILRYETLVSFKDKGQSQKSGYKLKYHIKHLDTKQSLVTI